MHGRAKYEPGIIAELATNDPLKVLSLELVGKVDRYLDYSVTIRSGDFSGKSRFTVMKSSLKEFAENLSFSRGSEIYDTDSVGYIKVVGPDHLGHVAVDARVGGDLDNYARVQFNTDQTALPDFTSGLFEFLRIVW